VGAAATALHRGVPAGAAPHAAARGGAAGPHAGPDDDGDDDGGAFFAGVPLIARAVPTTVGQLWLRTPMESQHGLL